jgi:hypothetical protein
MDQPRATSGELYQVAQIRVIRLGIGVLFLGVLLQMFLRLYYSSISSGLHAILWHVVILQIIVGLALVLTADVDLNVLGQSSPMVCCLMALVAFLMALIPAMSDSGRLFLICTLPLLYFSVRFKKVLAMEKGYPRFDQLVLAYLVLSGFCLSASIVLNGCWLLPENEWNCGRVNVIIGALVHGSSIPAIIFFYWDEQRKGRTPGQAVIKVLACFTLFSLGGSTKGGALIGRFYQSVHNTTIGFHIFEFIFLGVLLFFHGSLNGMLVRRWAKQRMKGGALIACMLEADHITVGAPYWINRLKVAMPIDLDLPVGNPARFFVPGVVTIVTESNFTVSFTNDQENSLTEQFDRQDAIMQPIEVLGLGKRQLRCLPAKKITHELLSYAGVGHTGATQTKMKTFELSAHCQPDEIDFFMSHSWSDGADAKFRHMDAVFTDFRARHGRDPFIWLDVCCIDQGNISADLMCLPVYQMSCKRVLVLCGKTYCSRLWCMW